LLRRLLYAVFITSLLIQSQRSSVTVVKTNGEISVCIYLITYTVVNAGLGDFRTAVSYVFVAPVLLIFSKIP